jgi:DNA-binding transcriptional LysR family regulator
MEMHQIRYFLAVCDTLNFTRAAARCNVAQPSLTRAIQKLEDELGGALFLRERGRTALTELGRALRPHFAQTLDAADTARAQAASFRKMRRAPVTLGVMCTIGPQRLVPLVNRLSTRVPGLEFRLREGNGRDMVQALTDGAVDAAIIGLPDYPRRLRAETLYRERYVVAFPPGHRFEAQNAVRVADMAGENYLERTNCEYLEFYQRVAGEWDVPINVRYQSEREDWIQAMILAGMGCAFMPEYMPLHPEIPTRVVVEPEIWREISLVTVRGRRFAPAVEVLVRMARGHDWQAMRTAA